MNKEILQNYYNFYGYDAGFVFSAPGRTEIGGNHTDHQHGKVLAASINLDTKAAVGLNNESSVRVYSENYGLFTVDLEDLSARKDEEGTTASLIRGICAYFSKEKGSIKGFDAYVISDVMEGSGLSSSASFEVLIATVVNTLNNCGKNPPEIARIAQYAENVYFGKPCGLMDQTACAVGNIISIDFLAPEHPVITPVNYDFSKSGHKLCIVDCGADHAGLTAEYAAIPGELSMICGFFGKKVLREISEEDFYKHFADLRRTCSDRAVLRAIHIYEDNKRVDREISALNSGNFPEFLRLLKESGSSSWRFLQNVTVNGDSLHQAMAVALAAAEIALKGKGACRIQGGGFAGTLQAFVPDNMADEFRSSMEGLIGKGCCRILEIRKEGAMLLEKLF